MSDFRNAVDIFLSKKKTLIGTPKWVPAARDDGISSFWLLEEEDTGVVTDHRLHIVAYPTTLWAGFCIMVDYYYMERHYPVIRLNVDTPLHEHINHPVRPAGVPTTVSGNRVYLWPDNRLTFNINMQGLPYARPLASQNIGFDNAIRYVCGEANINPYGERLPDYPRLMTLV